MPIWDQADDTLPAGERREATPPSGDPDDIGMQQLRAKVHGRLFGAPAQPVRIGRYDVTSYLGAGGMGVVYSGVDPELDRKVALKVLRSDTLGDRARERLRREAKALARLSHPNVVHVYEVGASGDGQGKGMFVAMEFVEGGTLTDWLAESERSTAEILARFVDAGRGLAAAHDAGLIHRDFKPDNVLLDLQGNPKVVDFGLVLAKEDPAEVPLASTRPDAPASASGSQPEVSLTVTGTLMGTPAYMAPEQHRGQTADARTDVFAFCVSLYEALFGDRPFGGDSYAALAQSVLDGELAPPPPGKRKVPRAVRRVIMTGLSVDPADRPQSMRTLLDVLSRPDARRRRLGVAAAGVVGAGAAIALSLPAATPDTDASSGAVCEAASTKLSGIWDDDTRAQIEAKFAEVDEPYAADAFASVAEDLDRWSAEWSGVWGDACTDALGTDADDAEAGMRTMRCLDVRMTELSQLRDSFVDADATIVARAPDAVADLSSPFDCIGAPLPVEENEAPKEVELRHRLARATSLARIGQTKRALEKADAIEAEARSLGFPRVVAQAGLLAARLSTSRPITTVQRLHRVVSAARETHDHRTEAIAWIEMLEITARSDTNDTATMLELALSWADMAQAALDRRPDPGLMSRLAMAVASIHRQRGDTAAARDRLATARALIDAPERRQRRDSRTILRLGQLEAEIGETDVAARYLDDAAALKRERLGRHHPDTIAALIEAAAVTRDRNRKTKLAGEAFANAVAGNGEPWKLEHAAHAMTLLTQIEAECPDSDGGAECTELKEIRVVVERALEDAGHEAADASRIAEDTTAAVKWSWARRPPEPSKPSKPNKPKQPAAPTTKATVQDGPAVRLDYGQNVVEVIVTAGEGARIELPDLELPAIPLPPEITVPKPPPPPHKPG